MKFVAENANNLSNIQVLTLSKNKITNTGLKALIDQGNKFINL